MTRPYEEKEYHRYDIDEALVEAASVNDCYNVAMICRRPVTSADGMKRAFRAALTEGYVKVLKILARRLRNDQADHLLNSFCREVFVHATSIHKKIYLLPPKDCPHGEYRRSPDGRRRTFGSHDDRDGGYTSYYGCIDMFYMIYPAAMIDEWYPYLAKATREDLAIDIQCISTSSRLFKRMKEDVSIIDVLSTDHMYPRDGNMISCKLTNYTQISDMTMLAAWIDRDVHDGISALSMPTLWHLTIVACTNEYIFPSSIGNIARLMRRHIYYRQNGRSHLQRLSGYLYMPAAKNVSIFCSALVDNENDDTSGRQDNPSDRRDDLIAYIFREMSSSNFWLTTTLIEWIVKRKRDTPAFIIDKIYPLMKDINTVDVDAIRILDGAGIPLSALVINDASTRAMLIDSVEYGYDCVDRVMRFIGESLDMSKHVKALAGSCEYIYAIFASEVIRRRGRDRPLDIPTNSSLLMSAVMCNMRFVNTPQEFRGVRDWYSCHLFIEHCVRDGLWVGSLDPRDYRAFISEVRMGMSHSDKAFVTRIIAERYMGVALMSADRLSDIIVTVVDE